MQWHLLPVVAQNQMPTESTELPTTEPTEPPTPEPTEPPTTLPVGTITNPASSCKDIPQDSPSGEYWIQNNNSSSPIQLYCDMDRTCCNTTGGWTRVAYLDMTDPSQQCPDGFRLITRTMAPLRLCGRHELGCVSDIIPVHGNHYSQVCGRILGYQFGAPDAFEPSHRMGNIDQQYVDGVSLTHGHSPRQHIWTFATGSDETRADPYTCPCARPEHTYTGSVPTFVGQDYFCATASRERYQIIFFPDDPLWDGQGCGGTSTCCSFNNPPWFCKNLPQPTTDDIELRLCGGESSTEDEDTPLEIVEVYIH